MAVRTYGEPTPVEQREQQTKMVEWVAARLGVGRSREEIIEVMVEEGYSVDSAQAWVSYVEEGAQYTRLDIVPRWLGWLALPIGRLTSIIGLGLYSYWAYRRGCREGVGLDPTSEPYDNFGLRVLGWGVAGFVPILGLYAVVHLPTICYKQGLRVGAREGTAFEGFTSLPAFGAGFAGMLVVALAALFIAV